MTMTYRTIAAPALAGALVCLLFLAAAPTAQAATTRVLTITNSSANPQVAFQAFDGNPPKVFDFNGDGREEIIAQNDNQWVYVFDSQDGRLLAQVKTNFPTGWGARSFNGPEVAIMTGDGQVRMVVANSAATITSYRFDASQSSSTRFVMVKEWERRLSDCHANPGMDGKPVLADLDKDGKFEILAATEEVGVFALRHDGRLFWKACIAGGNGEPAVGDLNQDGWPDVVFGSDGGHVTALNGRTGGQMWQFWVPGRFNVGAGSMPVGATIAQLDGTGGPDVVVGVRDSHDADDQVNNNALLLALNHNGQLLWGKQDPNGNPLTYTRPVVVDADKSGNSEVYWGDWNTNGHKPPFDEADAWQRLGPAHVYRFDKAGNQVWRQTLDTWWSNKDLAVGDVDGDGAQEVVANGPSSSGHDGLWYLNVATGAKETFVDAFPFAVQRGAILSDLWGDGKMKIVVPVGPSGSGSGHGLLVFDTGVAFDAAWPHLPYPELGGSPPPPPPPTGEFDATFTLKAPNAWWQEVFVNPDTPRTITKVEVRLNGDFWRSMTLRSWGAWTSSYNTPAGTQVDFLATDSAGAISQSATFTWMDGQLSKRNVPPDGDPEPPPFEAEFAVPAGVNEWWVEVHVTSSDPVNAVAVQVNGGTWQDLVLRDWGNWAKSIHAPVGSLVKFRATSSFGAEAFSDEMRWLDDGSAFSATFGLSSNVNNWWVEVNVQANRPVTRVEANVNGGPWTDLQKQSWGNWAKSFFVPSGADVRFRAHSDEGDQLTSAPFRWP